MSSLPSQLLSIAIPQLPSRSFSQTKADKMYALEYNNSELLFAKNLHNYYNFTHGTVFTTTSPSRSVFGDEVSDAEEEFFLDLLGVNNSNSNASNASNASTSSLFTKTPDLGFTDEDCLETDDDAASYYSTVSFASSTADSADAEAAIFPERFTPAQNLEFRHSITDLLRSSKQPHHHQKQTHHQHHAFTHFGLAQQQPQLDQPKPRPHSLYINNSNKPSPHYQSNSKLPSSIFSPRAATGFPEPALNEVLLAPTPRRHEHQ